MLKIQGYPQMTRLLRRLSFSPFSCTRGSWKANWLISVLNHLANPQNILLNVETKNQASNFHILGRFYILILCWLACKLLVFLEEIEYSECSTSLAILF